MSTLDDLINQAESERNKLMSKYMTRTKGERRIKKQFTKRDRNHNVWLVIDHQSFELRTHSVDGETPKEKRANAEWRRDMLAIALARMIRCAGGHVR